MSSDQEKVLAEMLTKLGMTRDDTIVNKAKEIHDLIKIKAASIAKSINDSATTVYCLDISCELLNIAFDEASAIRQASIRSKSSYQKNRKILMKLLNLNKKMNVSSLILRLGISSSNVEKNSKKILDAYQQQNPQADLEHPQYITMSIYQACKLEKLKIQKKNVLQLSNLKPNQWTMLEKSWDKWVGDVIKVEKENRQIYEVPDDENRGLQNEKKRKHVEQEEEDYDVWKKRILENARSEIAKK